ncbi:MAG: alpha/beta hydrolase [Ruminococcaceae bacterium]|nr:alpha/beta hydrolase [Oscillospiraceae bacterium]
MIQTDLVYGAYPSSVVDVYHAGDDAPLFVYFHGGGIEKGSKSNGKSGWAKELMASGISVADANYRMYPDNTFPSFLEDAAECVAWCRKNVPHSKIYVGGSSAGGYITMMLAFDPKYLGAFGINCADEDDIAGYFFDAGQPTVHFNVLKYSGEDSRLIRVDERSALWFIKQAENPEKLPRYELIVSEKDIYNRVEQNQLLYRTLLHFKYPEEKLGYTYMEGFGHCGYVGKQKEDGTHLFAQMVRNFINKKPLV